MTKQKDFIKLLEVFAFLALFSSVLADTIVVTPGDSNVVNATNPPDTNTPTVNIVACPAGYDCIQANDYNDFIASLKDFTKEIDERTQFFGAMFDRIDKKISFDENTINGLADIAANAQEQEYALQKKFDTLQNEKLIYEKQTGEQIKALQIQYSTLQATQWWQIFFVLAVALVLADVLARVRSHKKFIWRKIQEVLPFRFG